MPDCFIIMPITTPESLLASYSNDKDHFIHVLDHLFKPALGKVGLNPVPPIAEGADIIHGEIIRNIEKADLVLCDTSTLNANVFFELGIRTAVDRAVCIVKDDATPKVPFDTTIINYHTYLSALSPWTLEKQIDELAAHLEKSMKRSQGQNTLWKYFGLSTKAVLPEGGQNVDARLELLSLQIEGLSRRLEEQRPPQRESARKKSDEERLFDEIIRVASTAGAVIESAELMPGHMKVNVRPGTLSEETRAKLRSLAESRGIEFEIADSKRNK